MPHQPVNLSATEDAIAVVARSTPSEQETVFPYDGDGSGAVDPGAGGRTPSPTFGT